MSRQLVQQLGFLNSKKTLFLLCDVQEKFRPAIKNFDSMVKNTQKLISAGKSLEVPLICTEQYPEKLGNIVKELDIKHASGVYPKSLFSMAIPEINSKINELFGSNLESVVIFGIEAHICVEQTAMDFRAQGIEVHVVADCSLSRSLDDRTLAFERLKQIGCFVTTSENVIFKLLKTKDNPKFNDVRKYVSEVSADTGLSKL
ncbi:isochorismatase domain-containing protein 1-like [Bradysia coprophila]|uniref:isochorismatase domain-containing protein 1-like n=1 Tax=Bradysia coprophila TaxID=38358 RepID=UPI00187DAFF9|nr:isochorismatase domain-containing protein 1-like [Bradysia coprophila]